MKLSEIVEKRFAGFEQERKFLTESYSELIEKADKTAQAVTGKPLTEWQKGNIARLLDNTAMQARIQGDMRLFETTTSDQISYLGISLPVVLAIMPSLVLNEIAVTQALDRRTGSIFYANINAGTLKGSINVGDTISSAKTGLTNSTAVKNYATENVVNEPQGTSTSGTLLMVPNVLSTLTLVRGTETFTETSAGVLASNLTGGGTGTINTAGQWTVTGWIGTGTIYASYQYNFEKVATGVPEIDVGVTAETITAEDFLLRAKFNLVAAIEMQKHHGIDLEAYLAKSMGELVKFTMDHKGIDKIVTAGTSVDAATAAPSFAANPGSGQEYVFRKYEFLRCIQQGSNNIFQKTLKAIATYIVAGNNVAALISTMGADHFKPAGDFNKTAPTGPVVIGTLDGRTVVQDPLISTNNYTLGFKGDDMLNAGLVFAPFIPLFSTATLTTSDLVSQKGFYSAAGYKIVTPGAFCAGTISGI